MPVVGGGWEEVVEVPFTPASRTVRLSQWAGDNAREFELAEALVPAAEADALQAAVDGVFAAVTAFGPDDREVLDGVRRAHPVLGDVPDPPEEGLPPFPFFA